jgi:hypothetical protein
MVVIFHDRRGDRLMLRQPNSLFGAALLGVFALALLVVLPVMALRENIDFLAWFLVLLCVGFGIFIVWAGVKVATEIVAIFDGRTRTMTIRYTAPWRTRIETLPFEEVFVEAQQRSRLFWYGGIDAFVRSYYGISIGLPRERTVWLGDASETACYDMARQVMTLILRPAAGPAEPPASLPALPE